MDKLDEFKEFIRNKPFLSEKVARKEVTWQSLYETYDLFGKEAEIFKDSKEIREQESSPRNNGNNSILKMLEGVNLDKINENLEGMKKILGVLGEFSKKETPSTNNRRNNVRTPRRYDD